MGHFRSKGGDPYSLIFIRMVLPFLVFRLLRFFSAIFPRGHCFSLRLQTQAHGSLVTCELSVRKHLALCLSYFPTFHIGTTGSSISFCLSCAVRTVWAVRTLCRSASWCWASYCCCTSLQDHGSSVVHASFFFFLRRCQKS